MGSAKTRLVAGLLGSVIAAGMMYFAPKEISDEGVKHIQSVEGWRSRPYLDEGGVATIGWGATYYEDGTPVRMSDPAISKQRALELLLFTLDNYEHAVNTIDERLTQSQFDALCSFCFNVGVERCTRSTLFRVVDDDPNDTEVVRQFYRWIYVKGRVSNGLVYRRKKEIELYYDDPLIFKEEQPVMSSEKPDDMNASS